MTWTENNKKGEGINTTSGSHTSTREALRISGVWAGGSTLLVQTKSGGSGKRKGTR